MSIAKIRSALVKTFVDSAFGLDVVFDNSGEYEPQADKAWFSFTFIPNQPKPLTLGVSGDNEYTGIIQVDLNYPLNSGIGETMEKADEITAVFKPGYDVIYQGQKVSITSSGLSRGGVNENGFYKSTLTINWRAIAQR